jgi:hypothetical protein
MSRSEKTVLCHRNDKTEGDLCTYTYLTDIHHLLKGILHVVPSINTFCTDGTEKTEVNNFNNELNNT